MRRDKKMGAKGKRQEKERRKEGRKGYKGVNR